MKTLTVYFRPPEEFLNQLNEIAEDFEVVVCEERDALKSCLPRTEILITLFTKPDAEHLRLAPSLKWIQALTAGVDFFPLAEIEKQGITLTCGRGIHKVYIAEYAIAAMINLARNFHLMLRNQLNGKWDRSVAQDEIHGSTAGIIGLGSIGQEIAGKASMLGMRVIGVKNSPGPLEGVERVYGPGQMADVFRQSDYIINLLPDTRVTKGLIDNRFFSLMRPTACFINLGRGSTVNQGDLIDALRAKMIRAAVCDVYEEEPLPAESPLWQMENAILTPHIAGVSPQYLRRAMDIIRHNLKVYRSGTGRMINVVDPVRGY